MVVHSEVLAAYALRPTLTVQDPAAPRNYPHSGLPPDNSAQNLILQRSVVNRMLLRDHTGPKGNSSSTVYKTVVSGCGPRTAAHEADVHWIAPKAPKMARAFSLPANEAFSNIEPTEFLEF